jgi:hypothetical protein
MTLLAHGYTSTAPCPRIFFHQNPRERNLPSTSHALEGVAEHMDQAQEQAEVKSEEALMLPHHNARI